MARYVKWIRTLFLLLAIMTCAHTPVTAGDPEVETANPAAWVLDLEVKPPSNVPLDEIQNGQYHLLVDRQVRVAPNAPTQYFRHFAVQVVNVTGMEAASQISIVFDPEYQTLKLHSLDIHRNGEVINKLPDADIQLLRREEELESSVYDGRYTADAIVDDIRVGDIVEYAYTITGDNPIYDGIFAYNLDTNWNVPVLKNHFRLLWPKTRQLHQKSHNTDHLLTRSDHDDYTIYSYLRENIPPVRRNSETPGWYRRYGYIQMSEMGTWADVVAWALPLYRPAYQIDPEIKSLAERICLSAVNDENKVIHLLNYVQNDIRYLGIEFGVNSHKPSPPQETLERRFGDCKDKTVALIALLSAMGFESYPVLVNTRLEKGIGALHPTPRAFNHVLIRTAVNGKHYWLDPVRTYQGMNLDNLYQPDYGMALVLAPGETELTTIPENRSQVGVRIEETIDLQADFQKDPSYRLTSIYRGLNAEKMRRWFAEKGSKDIAHNYLEFYAKYYPRVVSAEPINVTDNPGKNEFHLQESYRIPDFWEKNEDTRQWECGIYTNALYTYLNKPEQRQRHEPFGISHPVDVRQTIKILLPEPWDIQSSSFSERNSHFEFTSKASYDAAANTITLNYHYRSFTDAVQPDELSGYLEALDRVRDELDYQLTRPFVTNTPTTRHAAWNWVQSNPLLVIIIITVAILLYCAIEWRLDSFKQPPADPGVYYPISLFKLFFLSLATFGLYQIYWFYRNWAYVKQRDDSAIMPFWRAVFAPLWFFQFYQDLKLDSEKRFGKSLLPKAPWVGMLLLLLIVSNIFHRIEGPVALLGLLGVLSLIPFANYILFANRKLPLTIKQLSAIRIRHYLLGCLTAVLVVFNISVSLNWIPSGAVVKGNQLPNWDIKFMQRMGFLHGDANLIYFYSDAFLFTRNDGNGVTDKNVFSYWYHDESDQLLYESVAFEDIEEISIDYAASRSDTTVVTIKPTNGSSFVLFASGEEGRDKLFVKAIQDRISR